MLPDMVTRHHFLLRLQGITYLRRMENNALPINSSRKVSSIECGRNQGLCIVGSYLARVGEEWHLCSCPSRCCEAVSGKRLADE